MSQNWGGSNGTVASGAARSSGGGDPRGSPRRWRRQRFLRGRRVDVQAITAELGLGRSTVYRWFGSREGLIGEVLVRAGDPLLDAARAEAGGRGAAALLATFDRMNRSLAAAPALRQFLEQEQATALRIITSSAGVVQRSLGLEDHGSDRGRGPRRRVRPARRTVHARLRDRAPRRGIPLQRRRGRHPRGRRAAEGGRGRAPRRTRTTGVRLQPDPLPLSVSPARSPRRAPRPRRARPRAPRCRSPRSWRR